ncbi:MAG: DUF4145 domain-containing protein [Pseudomonadota bacterium]
MAEATSEGFKSKRIYCNECKNETNHLLRGFHSRTYRDDDGCWEEEVTYSLWTCAGCDTGTLEVGWTAGGMFDGENQVYDYSYHPERASQDLMPKIFRQLPRALAAMYSEVVSAYNHQLSLLCAAGLRALIEGICQDKEISGRGLEKKIDGLGSILPQNIVQNLHGFRFMGNQAVHELAAPERDTLRLAIEVIEDLMNYLYELDYKTSRLRKKDTAR